MRTFRKPAIIISATLLLTVPATAFCITIKKETIPLVEMLQSGKASLAPDKKNIIDENGHIVAKATANTTVKPKPTPAPTDSANSDNAPPAPELFICNKKCAMYVKHCYMDEAENIVCINVCDKEALVCE